MKELNKKKGNYGEDIAVKELIKKGYTVLERNYRLRDGEIDIIAQKDETIVFAEVKLRTSADNGMPCEAVDNRKQIKIINTAKSYIQTLEKDYSFRFDVIEILISDRTYLRHIENAFWE